MRVGALVWCGWCDFAVLVARRMPKASKGNHPVFVHFIPPPLRKEGKKDLPWIVHTCDGSGCFEAHHVNFNTLDGFKTGEGQPQEQLEGKACSCQISNHHLRGCGRVRWEGHLAIIEADLDDDDDDNSQMINGQAYREEARRKADQLASAKDEISFSTRRCERS